jgi:hypothetical protein
MTIETQEKVIPEITLISVESSQLDAIGHDPLTNTLAIQFKGFGDKPGNVYHYDNFTTNQFAEFLNAESIGSYFKKNIRNAVEAHPYRKIS